MSTKLIFRSGLKTIGGTIVEVIKNNSRVVFDFGEVFDPQNNKSELPNVQGVYDSTSKLKTAILISHLHLDHTKAMNEIHPDIPIYMHQKSKDFLEDLEQIGFDQIKGNKRDYIGLQENVVFEFEQFKITPLLVDHDVLGACAFLIQTEDVNIFYSGDIRLHGYNSKYTYEMIEYIQNLNVKIDVGIFEGVTISFIEDDYEIVPSDKVEKFEKEEEFSYLVKDKTQNEDLILVNPYIMGLERVRSILDMSKKNNKNIAITPKFAYLVNKYYDEYEFKIIDEDTYNIGKDVVKISDLTSDDIVFFDYLQKEKYIDLLEKYQNNSALLQTGGEPLGEFDPRWKELEEYIKNNKVNLYKLGSSGHGSPENILYIIEEISPTFLMPLHSFKPELVKSQKEEIKQILPEQNKEYIFKNHNLI